MGDTQPTSAAQANAPLDLQAGRVDLGHGAGGRATAQLIDELFACEFANPYLARGDDGAVLPALAPGERLVVTTDAHVVSPLFFPGGDIGSLAVHGTINNLAVMGARPLYLAAAFVLEEGYPLADLARIVASMAAAADAALVPIVTGDTKVVEQGKGDGVFITTTGLGALESGREIGGANAVPGNAVLVSGTLGEHGMAVTAVREALALDSAIVSDTAPLHGLVAAMLDAVPVLRVLRDATRGGLAGALARIAVQSDVGIELDGDAIPVDAGVEAGCARLGLDPLHLPNAGKLVAVCDAADADRLLDAMRAHPLGARAARIGRVVVEPSGGVRLRGALGVRHALGSSARAPLPRLS